MALMRARADGPLGLGARGGIGRAGRGFCHGWSETVPGGGKGNGRPDLAQNRLSGTAKLSCGSRRSYLSAVGKRLGAVRTYASIRCHLPEDRSGAVLPSLLAAAAAHGDCPVRLLRRLAHAVATEDPSARGQV